MGEHEPLHLGVRAGPDGGRAEPGVADLAGVRSGAGPAVWPGPVVEVEEPGRTDHGVVRGADHGKRQGRSAIPGRDRRLDVLADPGLVLRYRGPAVQLSA